MSSSNNIDSWLLMPATQEGTAWEDDPNSTSSKTSLKAPKNDTAPSSKTSTQFFRDMNKRLRPIYEDAGQDYRDATTEVEVSSYFRKAVSLRKARVQEIFTGISLAKNVDLLFLLDVTGSMQPHLDAARDAIFKIVDELLEKKDGGQEVKKLRLGLLGYRDFGDASQFERMEFTESAEEFRQYCSTLTCVPGQDTAEDVFGGIEQALNMNWDLHNSGTRLIFHICDAPAHGLEYHEAGINDRYPDGDPIGRTHKQLFKEMDAMDIFYHFGRITDFTDKMLARFNDGRDVKIMKFDIKNPKNVSFAVVNAVQASVMCSTMQTMTNGRYKPLRERTYTFDDKEPDWTSVATLTGLFLSFEFPRSIEDIVSGIPLRRHNPERALVKIAADPFAKGVERVAFYGQDLSKNSAKSSLNAVDVVFKELAHEYSGEVAHRFEISNQVQTIAAYMASRFCEELQRLTGKIMTIEFLKTKTLAIKQGDQNRYLACEKRYPPGTLFTRFSNNVDYAMLSSKADDFGISSDYVELLMAFSHWTYQITSENLMIVDLQGIVHKNADSTTKILLTDPAIHCSDMTRYGPMNFGRFGMDSFLQRHYCNQFCRDLKLQIKK